MLLTSFVFPGRTHFSFLSQAVIYSLFCCFLKKSSISSISEGQIFWLWYSWLEVIFYHFDYIISLSHSLQNFYWKIHLQSYRRFFVCNGLLSLTTVSSLFSLTFDKWLKSSFVKASLHSVYLDFFVFHRTFDVHFSPQIEDVLSSFVSSIPFSFSSPPELRMCLLLWLMLPSVPCTFFMPSLLLLFFFWRGDFKWSVFELTHPFPWLIDSYAEALYLSGFVQLLYFQYNLSLFLQHLLEFVSFLFVVSVSFLRNSWWLSW